MYKHDYVTDYLFIEEDLTTSFVRLMYYVQETSLHHSNSTPYSMDWYLKNNTGFVLTGWNIKLFKLPTWSEKITVETWPSKFKGMLADRSFIVYDENKDVILKAQSNWIYMDLIKLKPIRVSDSMFAAYGPLDSPLLETKVKIPKNDSFDFKFSKEIITSISNIDSNHHVNNISYITFAIDALNLRSKDITDVSVRYVKETVINTKLILNIYEKDNHFLVEILDERDELKANLIFSVK